MTLENNMELDDFKRAWQTLDQRLALDHALRLDELRERRSGRARSSLRPLFWGQMVQIVFAIAILLLGVSTWAQHRETTPLFVSGVILHVYGVLALICAGHTLHLIRHIDYAAPVLEIQRRLLQLRRWHVGAGMLVGLSWSLLWIPFMICLTRVNIWSHAPSVIWIGGGIGVAILVAVAAYEIWLRNPGRQHLAQAAYDRAAGGSIVRAQALVDDWSRIERP